MSVWRLTCFWLQIGSYFNPQPPVTKTARISSNYPFPIQKKISALYWPHPQATYTLLYIHGNAEDLGNIRPQLTQLHQQGLNLLAYDYRGYGTSDGQPSEQNAYQEVEAAYAYLTQQLKIPAQRILVQGRSLGGGSAVYLASRRIVGGLILESTFTSIAQVLSPIPLFPFDKFPNLERLRQVRCPVLVIHGDQDAIIPISHGQRLYDAAPGPKQFFKVKDAGHNNLSDVAAAQYPLVFAEFMGLVERYHHPSAGLETR